MFVLKVDRYFLMTAFIINIVCERHSVRMPKFIVTEIVSPGIQHGCFVDPFSMMRAKNFKFMQSITRVFKVMFFIKYAT